MKLLTYDECCTIVHKHFGGNYGGFSKDHFLRLVRDVEKDAIENQYRKDKQDDSGCAHKLTTERKA
jgi:hypothetical protein